MLPIKGSSPRLRGTRRSACPERCRSGIIPALAGNTGDWVLFHHVQGDHPRACGEHALADGAPTGSVGSSPRLRGTPPFLLDPLVMHGIIPALAGNTPPNCRRRPRWWDHPRACGEHGLKLTTGGLVAGSSPRLRGTRFRLPPGPACRGIIPALAGNTDDEASLLRSLRDHPRACGEHFTPAGGVQYDRGSSPRLRGTRDGAAGRYSHCGIIPALAGNTVGKPQVAYRERIIPALAGNTAALHA